MASLDIGIVIAYFIVMFAIGFIANRKQNNMDDYYVAGRKRGTFSIMSLWLSSWIGGATILGTTQLSYSIGIGGMLYPVIICIGLLVFGLFAANRISCLGTKMMFITYPDMIEARYNKASASIAAISTILSYIAFTASQLVAAGSILSIITGWNMLPSYIIATIVVVVYTSFGGYLAVTFTDWIQFLIIFIGIVIVAFPMSLNRVPINALSEVLPASFFDIKQYGSWGSIIGLLLTTVFSFFTAMDSYTRMFAAKNGKVAKKGTLVSIVGVGFIALACTYLGFSARVLYPEIADSAQALPVLMMHFFPIGIRGVLLVAVLSAVMSTGDICILSASANFTNDIYKKYINKNASEKHLLKIGIITSLIVGISAAIMAWRMMNIISILYVAFTICSATLFIPTIFGFFWKRGTTAAGFWSMICSLIIVIFWYIAPNLGLTDGIFAYDAIWPGLIISTVLYFGISLTSSPSKEEKEKIEAFVALSNEKTAQNF